MIESSPEFWRAKAEEARAATDYLTNEQARQHMLNRATSDEPLAHMAERGTIVHAEPKATNDQG